MTPEELRARRAAAQLLHRPAAGDAAAVVRALLAVQAQDARAAPRALRARTTGLTAAAVEAALADGALVRGWLMRGTLHLVAREDYAWLHGLTAPRGVAGSPRRLGEEGVSADDAERAMSVIERALAGDGPLTRAELAERIAAHGIRSEGQAAPHLLGLAARRGIAVLGPPRDGEQAFALARDWLGAPPATMLDGEERERAVAELARRYLRGHGPATAADLAAWSGLPLRDARAGLDAIAGELEQLDGGLVDLADRPESDPSALEPRLLPAFDPYVLGWKDRGFAVPAAHARQVHPGSGMLRATATAGGVAVATWSARRRGRRLAVELRPFDRVDGAVATALDAEAADVARFEGLELAGV